MKMQLTTSSASSSLRSISSRISSLGAREDRLGVVRGRRVVAPRRAIQPHRRAASSRAARAQALDLGGRRAARCAPGCEVAEPQRAEGDALERDCTGWPTASHMRRTWRLRPSWIVSSSVVGAELAHLRGRGPAVVELDAVAQRAQRAARATGGVGGPSRGRCAGPRSDGCVSRWASSPSLVSRIRPVRVGVEPADRVQAPRGSGTSVDDRRAAVRCRSPSRRRRRAC